MFKTGLFSRTKSEESKRIYLDYAAATPLEVAVIEVMQKYLHLYGNPSAIHQEGVAAKDVINDCQTRIARLLQIKPEGVVFTSGGTESNNLALLGVVEQLHKTGRAYDSMEVLTTGIEHPSISETILELKNRGVLVKYVKVDEVGKVSLDSLRENLSNKTVLVSVALVNSEIGTIQNIGAIARVAHEVDKSILIHADAAQSPYWMSVELPRIGADIISLDAGKCGGPKGIGVLAWQKRVQLTPVLYGGGQQMGLRPGTESVILIAGATMAIEQAQRKWQERSEKVTKVRNECIKKLKEEIPDVILNGAEGEERVANNINISILGLDTEFAVVVLDKHGIAASTKSACSGAGGGESVVVKQISNDTARATSTIRLTLGEETTINDCQKMIRVLKEHVEKMKDY